MSSPVREQYLRLKADHADALLFFRLGDFYELFDADAEVASRELGLTLTGRDFSKGERSPMAGVPYQHADGHIARLIERGHKVAVAEQIGDPRASKGLVERRIVRVITPGTVRDPSLLDGTSNNYLAAILPLAGSAGIAYADITTGEFGLQQVTGEPIAVALRRELARIAPAECLWPAQETQTALAGDDEAQSPPVALAGCLMTPWPVAHFAIDEGRNVFAEQLGFRDIDNRSYAVYSLAVAAAGALVRYLQHTQPASLPILRPPTLYRAAEHMTLDAPTRRNLELTQTMRGGAPSGSLLAVLDRTQTPMGGRLLRRWLNAPLIVLAPLCRRQEAVALLVGDTQRRLRVSDALRGIGDVDRLVSRAQQGAATPRELLSLSRALNRLALLQAALTALPGAAAEKPGVLDVSGDSLRACGDALDQCEDIAHGIQQSLVDDPPANIGDGGFIRAGVDEAIDAVDANSSEAREWLAGLEAGERARTGIRSLKVVFSRVFGYAIEVSNANLAQVPVEYVRKQTVASGERYITPELKQREAQLLQAREQRLRLELAVLDRLRGSVAAAADRMLRSADAVSQIDVYSAYAIVALERHYVQPQLDEGDQIAIQGGRHPVVEVTQRDVAFVPNDTLLDQDCRLALLTGPNMAGKSTYLRQVALIVLLAQVGSFVPATAARIGLVDRIFTRVGAQDDLSAGQSTFMVEMAETSAILADCTAQSLLILDEIGRGTSTYDGLAIAQAVLEYLCDDLGHRAKTIFATHYHELTTLAELRPSVVNFRMEVVEEHGTVVFLRRVVPGGADRSYGVHVAELAGLPPSVVQRARQLLRGFESANAGGKATRKRMRDAASQYQLSLFSQSVDNTTGD